MAAFRHIIKFSVCVCVSAAEREAEVLYEVLFDDEFAGGLNIR